MYFISTLVLLGMICLFYVLYVDMFGNRAKRSASRLSDAPHTELETFLPHGIRPRRVKLITRKDLPELLKRSDGVILLDLRSRNDVDPLPFSGPNVLPTSPERLQELLPWLQPETSVILCGPPDACNALLSRLSNSSGSAAIYILGANRSAAIGPSNRTFSLIPPL
jgi:hypothetical protein